MNLSEKNQAEYKALGLPWEQPKEASNKNKTKWFEVTAFIEGTGTREVLYVEGKEEHVKFIQTACHKHHALVEQNGRLRDYMGRLWTELVRMQAVAGEEDYKLIEELLDEKEEALKQEAGK